MQYSDIEKVDLVECPRDAMQGIKDFIPTSTKVKYLNQLLKCGFHTVDCGSFVSPKVVPQMADTGEVLEQIDVSNSKSKLLVIVANERGAEEAVKYSQVHYLGFPLSLSETFQKNNTNRSISEAFETVKSVQKLCVENNKEQVVYLSMGFGNPYDDPYDENYLKEFTSQLDEIGIRVVAPSDTIGISSPVNIRMLFSTLIPAFPHIRFGAHIHSTPEMAASKIEAAWDAGCRRFDGAIKGYGGCPMARDELTGNIATEVILKTLRKRTDTGIEDQEFLLAEGMAGEVFNE